MIAPKTKERHVVERNTIKVWNAETGELLLRYFQALSRTLDHYHYADGRHVYTGGHDRIIRLWDLDMEVSLKQSPPQPQDIYALALAITGASFRPCAKYRDRTRWAGSRAVGDIDRRGWLARHHSGRLYQRDACRSGVIENN